MTSFIADDPSLWSAEARERLAQKERELREGIEAVRKQMEMDKPKPLFPIQEKLPEKEPEEEDAFFWGDLGF